MEDHFREQVASTPLGTVRSSLLSGADLVGILNCGSVRGDALDARHAGSYLDEVRLRRKETLTKVGEFTSSLIAKKDQRKGLIARVSTADSHLSASREAEESAEQEQVLRRIG